MKIKVIDILNQIARGETPPKKIIFNGNEYRWYSNTEDYYCEDAGYLFDSYAIYHLNDEVEILETTITINQDKEIIKEYVDDYILNSNKIEKLIVPKPKEWFNNATLTDIKLEIRGIEIKINEIIDRL